MIAPTSAASRLAAGTWAIATTLAAPALRLMLRRRAARGKEIAARLPERFGFTGAGKPDGPLLWLHAASVGESLSALPLLDALPPEINILFTTGTVTSARLLAARLPELGAGRRVIHRFVPLDVPAWAARFLDGWRPDAACFLEGELWPNLLAACHARNIPTALVNARMSAHSAAAWARAPGFARDLLAGFAFVAAQSATDAGRLRALGADPVVWGDLKGAAPPLPVDLAELARLSAVLGDRPRWLAASTHPADDEVVGRVHTALARRHPGLLSTIVPRHPDRGAALARQFDAARRSIGQPPPRAGGIWIADTLGELGLLYRCFPVVLMGKGFGAGGGQNFAEPAKLGCAVATGPAIHNFAALSQTMRDAGALQMVNGADDLLQWLDTMLTDPGAVAAMGRAALTATQTESGLPARLAGVLSGLMRTE